VIRLFIVSFVVLTTLIGGCAATTGPNTRRDPWYQAVVEPMQGNDARALRFYENVLKLKGAELARELNATRQEFDKDPSELTGYGSPYCCRCRARGIAMTKQY